MYTSGHCDDSSSEGDCEEEPPGPSAEGKWWHVPDEKIEALVQKERAADSAPARRPGRREGGRLRAQPRGDALDALLVEAGGGPPNAVGPAEGGKKAWRVSDQEIDDLVANLSSSSRLSCSQHHSGGGTTLSFAGSRSFDQGLSHVRGSRQPEKRISIWIFFIDSEDSMRLTVPPGLRIGPPKADRFAETCELGVSAKSPGMSREERIPDRNISLKSMIEELAEIEVSRQRLFYCKTPLINDERTLGSFGIADGDTLTLHIHRHTHGRSQGEGLVLACSMKLRLTDASGPRKYTGYTLRDSKHLSRCRRVEGDVYMQPKWISESNPRFFAKTGIATDGHGSHRPRQHFSDQPVYIADSDDDHLRAARIKYGVWR